MKKGITCNNIPSLKASSTCTEKVKSPNTIVELIANDCHHQQSNILFSLSLFCQYKTWRKYRSISTKHNLFLKCMCIPNLVYPSLNKVFIPVIKVT